MLQNIHVLDCEALVLFVSIAEQNGAKQHLKKRQLEPRGDQHSWFHHFKFRKHHLKPKKEAGIWGKLQYLQNMHKIFDGELAILHAYDPMCSRHTFCRGAGVQEIGLCLSISRLPRAQLCDIPHDLPPDAGNHGGEGSRDKWTSTSHDILESPHWSSLPCRIRERCLYWFTQL